jgi:hypothetical protein
VTAGPGRLKPAREGAAHGRAGEEAAAQEGSFQGVVAVGAAAAESCGLAGGVEAGDVGADFAKACPVRSVSMLPRVLRVMM